MLKSNLFRTSMKVLAVGIILWAIAAMIFPDKLVPGFAKDEPTELTSVQNFASTAERTVNYGYPDRAEIVLYAPGYDRTNRCRTDHYLTGQMKLSKPLEVHNIQVINAPGTPGGTTVTGGEAVDEDPFLWTWKIVSNYELSLDQLKEIPPPPAGYIKAGWADVEPYAPRASITFKNCLSDPPQPPGTPNR